MINNTSQALPTAVSAPAEVSGSPQNSGMLAGNLSLHSQNNVNKNYVPLPNFSESQNHVIALLKILNNDFKPALRKLREEEAFARIDTLVNKLEAAENLADEIVVQAAEIRDKKNQEADKQLAAAYVQGAVSIVGGLTGVAGATGRLNLNTSFALSQPINSLGNAVSEGIRAQATRLGAHATELMSLLEATRTEGNAEIEFIGKQADLQSEHISNLGSVANSLNQLVNDLKNNQAQTMGALSRIYA